MFCTHETRDGLQRTLNGSKKILDSGVYTECLRKPDAAAEIGGRDSDFNGHEVIIPLA